MQRKIILILIFVVILIMTLVLIRNENKNENKVSVEVPKEFLKEFVTEKGNNDIIRVKNFQPNQLVTSPLVVEGLARGMWFFEASFPVVLVDWDGKIIAQGIATFQPSTVKLNEEAPTQKSEQVPSTFVEETWMTENFVPFKAVLEFKTPENIGDFSKKGALILRKDNPSGLPEHDDALELPVAFDLP